MIQAVTRPHSRRHRPSSWSSHSARAFGPPSAFIVLLLHLRPIQAHLHRASGEFTARHAQHRKMLARNARSAALRAGSRHQGCARRSLVVRAAAPAAGSRVEQLRAAKAAVAELIKSTSANPILVRLGWHDAGTYDKVMTETWC